MSAQRRTTVKEKAPVPAAATAPAKRTAEKSPVTTGARAGKAADRGKPAATQQSVIVARTQSVRQLFRDSWSEMKKVNWPDQQTARNLTLLVVAISIVLGVALGGIDFLLEKLFQAMT